MPKLRKIPDKRLAKLVTRARRAGWRTENSTHGIKIYPANGSRPIAVHASRRGDGRAWSNAQAQARRAGLDV